MSFKMNINVQGMILRKSYLIYLCYAISFFVLINVGITVLNEFGGNLYTLKSKSPRLLPLFKDPRDYYNNSILYSAKENVLIDKNNFKFKLKSPKCYKTDKVFLVTFVHSGPANFKRRDVIRRSWGNEDNLLPDTFYIVFMVGDTKDASIQAKINEEHKVHGDIVQGNFVDAYRNLTYKFIMGLKWVNENCRQARYILKTDDDVFINIFQLSHYLKGSFGTVYVPRNLISCFVTQKAYVKRSHRSKWFVSFKEFKFDYYPAYCSGWFIVMTPDVVSNLFIESFNHGYFWVDDVHVSGTLSSQIGINHDAFDKRFPIREKVVMEWLKSRDIAPPTIIGYPDIDTDTVLKMWNKTKGFYVDKL